MEKIEIRFSEVMNLSRQILAAASTLQSQADENLLQILCATKKAYLGESADLLAKKEVRLNEKMREEINLLRILAEELEERAKDMYQSECISQMMAKTRSY